MDYGKRQLLVDTVILPPSKKRKHNVGKPETGPQPTGTSEGTVPASEEEKAREARREYDRTRNQSPERKDYNRLSEQKRRQRAKENDRCRNCSRPAIQGQTRCSTCAANHRQSRRRSDDKRREAAKGNPSGVPGGTTGQASQPDQNGV